MFGGVQTAAQLMVKVGADVQEAQQKLGGVSASLGKLSGAGQALGTVMKVGVVGGVAAAGAGVLALGKILSDSVGEAMAAQEGMAQLNAVLASTQGVSGMTAASVTAIADSLSQVTRFEDDAIVAGQSMLLTFTKIGSDVFPQATETMLNMSQAIGQDLQSSAIQLGKALNDPVEGISALSRVGIQFTDAQKEQIKAMTEAGDIMGAQKVILAELETQFGNSARAAGETFAGQMDILNNTLGNVKEEIGAALLPALGQLAQQLGPMLITAAQGLANFLITYVVPALSQLFAWLGENLPVAIAALANFWTNTLQPALATVWAFIQGSVIPILQEVFAWLANNIPPAIATLANFWTNTLQPALAAVWNFIQGSVIPILQEVYTWLATTIPPAIATLADFWTNTLLPAINAVWAFIQNYLVPLFTSLVNVTIAALRLALTALAVVWEQVVKPALNALWVFVRDNIIPIFQAVADKLEGPVTTALNALRNLIEGAVQTALNIFRGGIDAVKGAIDGIVGRIQTVIGWIDTFGQKLASLAPDLPDWLTPGSPTPLELGLIGIGQAFAYAGRMAQTLENGLNAIGDLEFDEELMAYITALGTVADNLGRVLATMLALAGYGGVPSLEAKLQELSAAILIVTNTMQDLAEAFAVENSPIWSAKAVLDPLAAIFNNLTTIVDAFGQIADLVISKANITLFAENLRELIPLLVNALVDAAGQINMDGLPAAVLFSQAAGAVMGIIRDAVDALGAFQDYAADYDAAFNYFENGLWRLKAQIVNLVEWLMAVSADLHIEGVPAAVAFGQAVGAVMGAISAAVDALGAFQEYDATFNYFENGLWRLKAQIVNLVDWLMAVAGGLNQEGMPAARLFAEAAGLVMRLISQSVEALGKLQSYVGPGEDKLNAFMRDLQFLLEKMVRWVTLIIVPIAEDLSEEMMAALTGMVEMVGDAVGTLGALVDYVSPGETAIQAFMSDMDSLVRRFVVWATGSRNGPLMLMEIPPAFIELFGDLMSALETAIGTLSALVDYISPGEAAIQAFMSDMDYLVRSFIYWAMASRNGPLMLMDIPPAFIALFTDLMSGLGEAVAVLVGLADYVTPGQAAISAFTRDYQQLFTSFVTWASTAFAGVALDVVTAVGAAVGTVFNGLGAAVDTLQAMTYYVGPTSQNINRFMDDMEQIMIRLRDWALGAFTTDSMAFLEAFGSMAGTIFSALGQALDLMSGIADYTVTGSQFDLALQRFNLNLFRMINSWRIWIVDTLDPETMALVAQFATVMGGIVAGFRDALNLLMDLDNASLPTADELQAFLDAVVQLFNGVIGAFGSVASSVVDLAGMMSDALELTLTLISDYVDSFGGSMSATILTMFEDLAVNMFTMGNYVAGMFYSGMLRGMQNVNSQNAILDAMNQLALDLKDVLMAAWGISSPSKVAMRIGEQFVAGLAVGLQDLQGIPSMIEDAVGLTMANNVRIEPAPQRAYLTISFEGAWQSGMSPAEENRITTAVVREFRRQGLYVAAR